MSDDDRRWLRRRRLERDPFPETRVESRTEPGAGHESPTDFFARGTREKQMELLADTSTLGRPLIAMIGEAGVGKTTFFHALLERLPPDVRVVPISAGVFLSGPALLEAVATAMGVPAGSETSAEVRRAQLHARMRTLQQAGTPCVIAVDDAGELDGDALEELVQLAELAGGDVPGIRIILFSLPGVREALALAAGEARVDALIHEMVLERYSLDELRGYLQFRLARAGLAGPSPFSEADCQMIFRSSGGLPGRANVVAGRMLRAGRGALPSTQIWWLVAGVAASLLLTAVLLVLLEVVPVPGSRPAAAVKEAGAPALEPADVPGAAAADAADAIAGHWLPLPGDTVREPTVRGAAGHEDEGGDEPVPPDASPSTVAAKRQEEVREQVPETDADDAAEEVVTGVVAEIAPDAAEDAAEETVEEAVEEIGEEDASGVGAPVVDAEPVSVLVRAPDRAPVRAPNRTQAAAPRVSPASEASSEDGFDAAALRRADPAHYTLQLLVSSTAERASAWVAARSRPETFRLYRRTRDGVPQFVVVQGDYADLAAARDAAPGVAAETGVESPWIRRLRDVQAEVAQD